MIQWNPYKATPKLYGLSRQVVFHDTENKHNLMKTVLDKLQNICVFIKTSLVSLYRFYYNNNDDNNNDQKIINHFISDLMSMCLLNEMGTLRKSNR